MRVSSLLVARLAIVELQKDLWLSTSVIGDTLFMEIFIVFVRVMATGMEVCQYVYFVSKQI